LRFPKIGGRCGRFAMHEGRLQLTDDTRAPERHLTSRSRPSFALTPVFPIASLTHPAHRAPRPSLPPRLENFEKFLLLAPVILFSMVAHEYAHGYAALKQGDPTAQELGRLTWNPLKHIDPFMTVLLPLLTFFGSGGSFIFGGAKPVPVMPSNYRNYRRGDIIVSLAGIVTNLALTVVCTLLVVALGLVGRSVTSAADSVAILQQMMERGIIFNLVLAIFNLLPIPPLDGSHVVKYLLPPAWALRYQQFGRFGIILLVLLISTRIGEPLFNFWMTPVVVLYNLARTLTAPFILASPFTLGL